MSRHLMTSNQRTERLQNYIYFSLLAVVGVCIIVFVWNSFISGGIRGNGSRFSFDVSHVREIVLSSDADESRPHNPNCRYWNCLNLYRCGQKDHDRLSVYVYPLQDFVDSSSGKAVATLTREYYQILESVVDSPYYSSNPNEACLFLPSIDLLNEFLVDPDLLPRSLAALEYWDSGENHLIFNMIPRVNSSHEYDFMKTDRAVILGANFDTWTYRPGFDIALPVWSPRLQDAKAYSNQLNARSKHTYLLIANEDNKLLEHRRILRSLSQDHPSEFMLLHNCKATDRLSENTISCLSHGSQRSHDYPKVLNRGNFCLLSRSVAGVQSDLLEALAHNCIPVVAINNYVLPFEDVLDWSLFAVRIRESELHSAMFQLKEISDTKIDELKRQGAWIYNRYFKDLRVITRTALEIMENRVFPHRARSLREWNSPSQFGKFNPLFLPLVSPKSQGFTAVILTYDRVESLFTLIQKLSVVPSLQSILVIWNNQNKPPPHLSAFPPILKPLKIIQTRANKLSNRFYPYSEIETEAILTIDDDINMLTTDELDFGFEVWREFPDRIVGFPSRIHVWDNETMHWRYQSEWMNEISMVLTGAAFYHKYWSHMYTYAMPGDIKDWVDEHMNCEDIAMNFLVANITNKPPIKVTPRKKFKCPECTNTEMLSADLNHMRERSLCIDRFAAIYGRMPLQSVEFRADPVLFRDNFPEKLKRFNDIGNL